MFTNNSNKEIKNPEVLFKCLYHTLAIDISIIKSRVDIIEYSSHIKSAVLSSVINDIEFIFDGIKKIERNVESMISHGDQIQIVCQTAHDIAEFVSHELEKVESQLRNFLHDDSEQLLRKWVVFQKNFEITRTTLNDLKYLSKGLQIRPSRFDVLEIFDSWQNLPRYEHATIVTELPGEPTQFYSDHKRILGFVNELIKNCEKHNQKQDDLEIRIAVKVINRLPEHLDATVQTVQLQPIPSQSEYLAITISDNGQGVPHHKKKTIFSYLNTTSPNNGRGIGLYFIKQTLKVMNGHIFETGTAGAKFEIYIPENRRGGE